MIEALDSPIAFFYGGWEPILRIVVIGVASYAILITLLRFSGARTLANLDPFDFIIIVGIGSTFGRLLTAHEVALTEAATAFVLLIGLQVLVSWLRTHHPRLLRAAAPHPALLAYRGRILHERMERERLAEADLISTVREHGLGSLEDVEAIVLEPNGKLSVVPRRTAGGGSALRELVRRSAVSSEGGSGK